MPSRKVTANALSEGAGQALRGRRAKTKTLVPALEPLQQWHRATDIPGFPDADMLVARNVDFLASSAFSFISASWIGGLVDRAPDRHDEGLWTTLSIKRISFRFRTSAHHSRLSSRLVSPIHERLSSAPVPSCQGECVRPGEQGPEGDSCRT